MLQPGQSVPKIYPSGTPALAAVAATLRHNASRARVVMATGKNGAVASRRRSQVRSVEDVEPPARQRVLPQSSQSRRDRPRPQICSLCRVAPRLLAAVVHPEFRALADPQSSRRALLLQAESLRRRHPHRSRNRCRRHHRRSIVGCKRPLLAATLI